MVGADGIALPQLERFVEPVPGVEGMTNSMTVPAEPSMPAACHDRPAVGEEAALGDEDLAVLVDRSNSALFLSKSSICSAHMAVQARG